MSDIAEQLSRALAGRYVIEQEIGAGGMATVYRAHDVRHNRKVALKVLNREIAALIGAERFLKEIEVTANLQHPHILQVYDSGHLDDDVYYVMPYVDGESLRARLNREKQLPIGDAVRIATEVAGALDYAHRHGVIHRDIKPENILLHDGGAFVADFGIAIAVSTAGGSRLTQTGMSIGTPQYMSPEQAMGERELDARTDVFALGCVLYEMLVGGPPFEAKTPQAIVARVLTEKPGAPSSQRETVPPYVDEAVLTALEKLPADRWPTAAAFAARLDGGRDHEQRRRTTHVTGRSTRTRSRSQIAAAIVILLLAGWLAGRYATPPARAPAASDGAPSRLALLVPRLGASGAGATNRQLGLVPDGSAVVFVESAVIGGHGGLAIQLLHEETGLRIPGTEMTYAPVISPDGRWIALRNQAGDAAVIPITGTTSRPAAIASGFAFYAWHPDGSLWLTRPPYRRMERYRPGAQSLELMLDSLPAPVIPQQILADGQSALIVQAGMGTGGSGGDLALIDLRTGAMTTLISEPVITARYGAGHLVYAGAAGTLLARPFDSRTHELGTAVTIAQNVSSTNSGDMQFDVASNGTLVYIPEEPRALVHVDWSGTERPLLDERHAYHMPRYAPDGRRIAVDYVTASGRDVWVLDLAQRTQTRATFDGDGHDASWGPGGRDLIYLTSRGGTAAIYRITPGSGTPAESLFVSPQVAFTGIAHPNRRDILTVGVDLLPGSAVDIAVLRNGGRGPLEPLVATRFNEQYPALSPDGRWFAFISDQSGEPEVYARSWSGAGDEVKVSQGGGSEPVWSSDGRELFYQTRTATGSVLIAARLETAAGMRVVERRTLFAIDDYVTSTPHANYDVAPDGSGLVVVRRSPAARIMVIQNLPALAAQLTRN